MRFVVIGTSGSGKSTFAKALARAARCPYVELDRLYWGPGWTAVSAATFESAVKDATEGDCWVADGNYSAIRDLLWSRATHIVWLNFSRPTVFSRLFRRTLGRILLRTSLWHGNRESFRTTFFSRDSVLLWALTTFSKNQRRFATLRQDPKYGHLQWTEITESSMVSEYIRSQERALALPTSVAGA